MVQRAIVHREIPPEHGGVPLDGPGLLVERQEAVPGREHVVGPDHESVVIEVLDPFDRLGLPHFRR